MTTLKGPVGHDPGGSKTGAGGQAMGPNESSFNLYPYYSLVVLRTVIVAMAVVPAGWVAGFILGARLRKRDPELWAHLTSWGPFPAGTANVRFWPWLLWGKPTAHADVQFWRDLTRFLLLTWVTAILAIGPAMVAALEGPWFDRMRWHVSFWGFGLLFLAAGGYGQRRYLLWRRAGPGVPQVPDSFLEYWFSVLHPKLLRIWYIVVYIIGLAVTIPVLVWAGRVPP
jgi:hypothetical protein